MRLHSIKILAAAGLAKVWATDPGDRKCTEVALRLSSPGTSYFWAEVSEDNRTMTRVLPLVRQRAGDHWVRSRRAAEMAYGATLSAAPTSRSRALIAHNYVGWGRKTRTHGNSGCARV